MSAIQKIRTVWETVEVVAEELILTAESIEGITEGKAKKAFVVGKLIEFLKQLEVKHNVIPGAFEGVAFTAIEFCLDFIVERVFKKLKVQGVVGVAA